MIYLFYGDDSFNLSKKIEDLVEAANKAGAEVLYFRVENIADLTPTLLAKSFFSTKRLFVVNNILEAASTSGAEALMDAVTSLDSGTDIIFVEEKSPKKSKLADLIKTKATAKNFEIPKNVEVVSYIKEKTKEYNSDIAPLAAERLATLVGPDMWQLEEEIKKLVLFTRGTEEQIQTSAVELLVKSDFESTVFVLLDAISTKNTNRAAELINSFIDAGENAIYILTMIEWQFRNIAMAKFEEGISEFALSKKAKLNPFVAKKAVAQARNFTQPEILSMYRKMVWADLKLKSGHDPKQVLLRLVA